MDINTIRTVITVLALVTFLAIVAWAWSSRRHADFDAAARLVLDEEEGPSNDAHRENAK
jgi:cytochrome c oxidase cbb3-type subunit IV